jgi:hypothetical protein
MPFTNEEDVNYELFEILYDKTLIKSLYHVKRIICHRLREQSDAPRNTSNSQVHLTAHFMNILDTKSSADTGTTQSFCQ